METEKWIILTMQEESWLSPKYQITDVQDIAACDDRGVLLIFDSFEDCQAHQEDNGINGRCVELPLY